MRSAPAPPPPLLPTWTPAEAMGWLGVSPATAEHIVWPVIQAVAMLFAVLTLFAMLATLERRERAVAARFFAVWPWDVARSAFGTVAAWKRDGAPMTASLLAALAIVLATCAVAVVPFGAVWATGSSAGAGLLLVVLVSVLLSVAGGVESGTPAALRLLGLETGAWLALAGPLMFAGTMSLQEIVGAQRYSGVWYVFVQPQAFVIFVLASANVYATLDSDDVRARGGWVAGIRASTLLKAALVVTVFLGGWSCPGLERLAMTVAGDPSEGAASQAVFSIVFVTASCAVFFVKIAVTLHGFVRWRDWPAVTGRTLTPASLVSLFLSAFFFVAALKPANGGLLGVVEPVAHGMYLSWAAYIYFGLAAIVTAAASWPVVAWARRAVVDAGSQVQTAEEA